MHGDRVAEQCGQPLRHACLVRRVDLRRAAAHVDGVERVTTDQRHPRTALQWQHAVPVGQHRHALGREPGELLLALRAVRRRQSRGVAPRRAERADAVGEQQQAPQMLVDHRLRHLAGLDRGDQRLAPRAVRSGHDQVQAAVGRRGGRLGGEPVRHDQTLVRPLALDDVVDHMVLLGGRHAVDVVVGRHHRPRVGVGGGDFERQQVQLAQRGLVDDAVHGVAVGLGLVGHQVLQAGTDPAVLQPAHIRGGELAGEQRILRVRLEDAPAQQGPVQVDRRPEDDVDLLGHRLLGQQPAHLVRGLVAPRRGEQGGVREQRHRAAAAELQPAHTGRTVRQPDLGQADRLARGEGERAGPGQQPDLVAQRQLLDQAGVLVRRGGVGRGGAWDRCHHLTPFTGRMAIAPMSVSAAAVRYSRV
jgi:hypothetical protein